MSRSFWSRLLALFRKELRQIRRDRRLMISLVVPPTLQIVLFGLALDPTVSNQRLGIVDESQTPLSREFIAALTQSRSFRDAGRYMDASELSAAVSRGELDAGVVIPPHFTRDLLRQSRVDVQVILNAVNVNNATIGQAYVEGVIAAFNQRLTADRIRPAFQMAGRPKTGSLVLHTAFLYNPGLVNAWFIVTGTFGILIVLNSSLVSSVALLREREAGTVEQLLMTPAGTAEIILAKIAPLFFLLMGMVLFAIGVMKVVFAVPTRGHLSLVIAGAALCILCGIGIGTFVATFSKSAQQAQLLAFFINPPLATLSGATTPVEAMPHWLQPVTWLNPIRHFAIIVRDVFVKGAGLDALGPHFAALMAFAVVLMSLSILRFRRQLG